MILQQRNEPWNGCSNFLAELDFIGISDVWIRCNYKLTMISEPGEYRNYSMSNATVIVIQQRKWNGCPNFLAKLDFIPALAMSG
jgi:hypothetical protein